MNLYALTTELFFVAEGLNERFYKKRAGQLAEALIQVGAIAATPVAMTKVSNYLRGNF